MIADASTVLSGDEDRDFDALSTIRQSRSKGAVVSLRSHTPYQVTTMVCTCCRNLALHTWGLIVLHRKNASEHTHAFMHAHLHPPEHIQMHKCEKV